MCYVSHVTSHVSLVTCQKSCVTCHMLYNIFFVVKLVGGGSVLNRAYPFYLVCNFLSIMHFYFMTCLKVLVVFVGRIFCFVLLNHLKYNTSNSLWVSGGWVNEEIKEDRRNVEEKSRKEWAPNMGSPQSVTEQNCQKICTCGCLPTALYFNLPKCTESV